MTIGELATAARVNAQTVRYYERRGILAEPPRTDSGYRQYEPEALARLRFIKRAQELGFTLEDIRELLELRVEDPAACPMVQAKTQTKLEKVQRKIRELERMERVLDQLAASCAAREATAECPILEMLVEAEHA